MIDLSEFEQLSDRVPQNEVSYEERGRLNLQMLSEVLMSINFYPPTCDISVSISTGLLRLPETILRLRLTPTGDESTALQSWRVLFQRSRNRNNPPQVTITNHGGSEDLDPDESLAYPLSLDIESYFPHTAPGEIFTIRKSILQDATRYEIGIVTHGIPLQKATDMGYEQAIEFISSASMPSEGPRFRDSRNIPAFEGATFVATPTY